VHSRIIARKNPVIFKTQAIHVKASPEVLCYTPVGNPLGFAATCRTTANRFTVKTLDPFAADASPIWGVQWT